MKACSKRNPMNLTAKVTPSQVGISNNTVIKSPLDAINLLVSTISMLELRHGLPQTLTLRAIEHCRNVATHIPGSNLIDARETILPKDDTGSGQLPASLTRQDLIDLGRDSFQDAYDGENHAGALIYAIEMVLNAYQSQRAAMNNSDIDMAVKAFSMNPPKKPE